MEELKNVEGHSSAESSLVTPESPATSERSVGSNQDRAIESVGSLEHMQDLDLWKSVIDTAAPIDSVKSAVSKFGGIVDWKAHKVMALEKHTHIQNELDKVQEEIPKYKKKSEAAQIGKDQVLEELDSTKKLVEELRDSLEKTETEEAQAKQDSELAQLRVKEMEQGISDDASAAAKAQLDVAKARHKAAAEELKSVKDELTVLQGDYTRLVSERNFVVIKSEEAVVAAKDAEKKAEGFTLELIALKEALESAHASHLEAEERRVGVAMARDQDSLVWEEELKHAKDELKQLDDLKSRLETSSGMLLKLKTELSFFMEGRLTKGVKIAENDPELTSAEKELEDINATIERKKYEAKCLREAASSLKAELDREKETLATLRQREAMTSVTGSSLEAELTRMQSELELVVRKEKEAREKMEELPKLINQATQESDQAKSIAYLAREELNKAKEEAEQCKRGASTMEARLVAALKEIEAAKASEKLAAAATKAMLESGNTESVSLQLEDYYKLSKNAHDAEELANERVISDIEKIKKAKNSEVMKFEKLEEAQKELDEKKVELKAAITMAEKANEGKLAAEQELRDWRAENELRRRASDAATSHLEKHPSENFDEADGHFNGEASLSMNLNSCPDPFADPNVPELKLRRKKSFFPRIVMFLARKKPQTLK